ncbi:hypothetical protein SBA5_410001 [Candidatus Sulfotelmatomonas gaucii]|uniref:Uncharacterized protein n=1 Tax=Candidatus Sulfuritelmatomonas gaucii TaxID=2043161 RepID=A0A2N9LL04_9BACT|nr:hypothetical protein SBA5_410001 [Candidatus Sulfotelmatomonas gaucii]
MQLNAIIRPLKRGFAPRFDAFSHRKQVQMRSQAKHPSVKPHLARYPSRGICKREDWEG